MMIRLTCLKKKYNSHRVAFALRGLTNTYNFRDDGVQNALRNISVRHDISGDYPQSTLDFRAEKELVAEARKPLDNLYDCLRKLSLEDVDEEAVEEDNDEMEI